MRLRQITFAQKNSPNWQIWPHIFFRRTTQKKKINGKQWKWEKLSRICETHKIFKQTSKKQAIHRRSGKNMKNLEAFGFFCCNSHFHPSPPPLQNSSAEFFLFVNDHGILDVRSPLLYFPLYSPFQTVTMTSAIGIGLTCLLLSFILRISFSRTGFDPTNELIFYLLETNQSQSHTTSFLLFLTTFTINN